MTTLPAAIQTQLDIIHMEIEQYVEVNIQDDKQFEQVGTILRSIKSYQKVIEEKRLEVTRPIDEEKAAVMAAFAPTKQKLADVEKVLKAAILDYNNRIAEENRKRQEEEDRRAKEAAEAKKVALIGDAETAIEEGKPELAVTYLNKAEEVVAKPIDVAKSRRPVGIATQKIWKYEITDASKLPREFLIPDTACLQKYAVAMKEKATVEGVRFFCEEVVSARKF